MKFPISFVVAGSGCSVAERVGSGREMAHGFARIFLLEVQNE